MDPRFAGMTDLSDMQPCSTCGRYRLSSEWSTPMNHPAVSLKLILLAAAFASAPGGSDAAPLRSPCVAPTNTASIGFRSGRDEAGNGCSEGKYSHALPLRERATEALAAVQMLRDREDIDPKRIGLWGASQGAWVAPMAAVRSRDIAFLITVSAPGRDAISQMIFAAISSLRESGVGAAEADRAHTTLQRAFVIARAGGTPEEFLAAVEPLQKYSLLRERSMLDVTSRGYMSAVQYVPEWSISADIVLTAVRQPTLAIFGDRDPLIDTPQSIAVYRNSFARSGNHDLTVRTLRNAAHEMIATSGNNHAGSMLATGYIGTMIAWLKARNFARSDASSTAANGS
jgi:uncharacterized protein